MLEVLEPGLLSTVQDFGRPDAVGLGVPESGACDRWSLSLANALVGNSADTAALELTLVGPTLRVLQECLVGLAGADLDARLDGEPWPPCRSRRLRSGQTLSFGTASDRAGLRAYVSLGGGIDVPLVLGSASTCLVGGFGGLAGRPLSAGDVLACGPARGPSALPERECRADFRPADEATRRAIRVVRGPHADRLPGSAFLRLLAAEFGVSPRADRQGMVLDGPRLPASERRPMLSQGVAGGAIQLPPDGHPICLLADHQTVGGYPVLAVVISADLPLLGQLSPGDPVTFREVSLDEAADALRRLDAEWRECLGRLESTAA